MNNKKNLNFMQEIKLISVDCIDQDRTLGNEAEFQMTQLVEKRIREFNKESLKNERQARLTDQQLLQLFTSKKKFDCWTHNHYIYDAEMNAIELDTDGFGNVFRIKIGIK